jgi:Lsr2
LKLTIDSAEALEDTLRVVGALYNVTLEASPSAGDSTRVGQDTGKRTSTQARPTRASGARARRRPSKRARSGPARAATGAGGQVSTAAVRSWARENGYAVADRGRVPAEVVTAYRNAQPA